MELFRSQRQQWKWALGERERGAGDKLEISVFWRRQEQKRPENDPGKEWPAKCKDLIKTMLRSQREALKKTIISDDRVIEGKEELDMAVRRCA